MLEFKYSNFVPREGFDEEVHKTLGQIERQIPKHATTRATGVGFSNGFLFSMVVMIDGKMFSSEVYIQKANGVGRSRLWLVPMVQTMIKDVERQINQWKVVHKIPLYKGT